MNWQIWPILAPKERYWYSGLHCYKKQFQLRRWTIHFYRGRLDGRDNDGNEDTWIRKDNRLNEWKTGPCSTKVYNVIKDPRRHGAVMHQLQFLTSLPMLKTKSRESLYNTEPEIHENPNYALLKPIELRSRTGTTVHKTTCTSSSNPTYIQSSRNTSLHHSVPSLYHSSFALPMGFVHYFSVSDWKFAVRTSKRLSSNDCWCLADT